ncbi:MAG: hypothetical protein AMXMBFR82_05760 [Candidatus Hydrogenedentota bacterium]
MAALFFSRWALGTLAILAAGCGGERKIANLDSAGIAIVAFGDSITYGHGVPAEQTYPALLSEALGEEIINAGRNGDTTASGLQRLERDVLDHDPRIVIVELGGNDFLNKVPREETFANLDQIVAQCIDAGAMVILVHIQFGFFSDKYLDEYEAIAERYGALLVPDLMDGIFGRPSMMVDQIHPNAEGQRVIAQRVGEALVDLLERSNKARAAAADPGPSSPVAR